MSNLLIIGPPGSGKTTLAAALSSSGYHIISMGALLRAEAKNNRAILFNIQNGILVADELACRLFKQALTLATYPIAVEGFPSTAIQYAFFEKEVPHFSSIYLDISDEEVIKRVVDRRICQNCGTIYHLTSNPPKLDGTCDTCHSLLVCREEDRVECITRRLKTFKETTLQVLRR